MTKSFTNFSFTAFICCLAAGIFAATTVNAQPPNDDCAGAVSLTQEISCTSTLGDVANATQSLPGCAGTAGDDVWFSFMAVSPTPTIQVVGSADFDAVVEVFEGDCGAPVSLVCRDNNFSGGGTETIESTDGDYVELTPGETYFVRVYDWYSAAPATTEFDICVFGPPCANPPAVTATPVCDETDGDNFYIDVDVAFGSGASYTITTDYAGFTPIMVTAEGITQIGPFANDAEVVVTVTDNGNGNCFAEREAVSENCTFPEDNDDCANAETLNIGDSATGNTLNAVLDPALNGSFCGATVEILAGGLWYSVTGDGSELTASTCGDADYDTQISVFEGSCGSLSCIGGNDDATGCGTTSEFSWQSTAGTQYYVFVHGYGDAQGNFTLTMTGACVNPTITATADCIASDTDNFYVNVQVDFGTGTSYTISNSQNTDTETVASTGSVTQVGPFANGTTVDITVTDDNDATCAVTETGLTEDCSAAGCTPPGISATTSCEAGDTDNFYIEVSAVLGSGTNGYTLSNSFNSTTVPVTAAGNFEIGPFPNGTSVDVTLTDNGDATCSDTETGLVRDCSPVVVGCPTFVSDAAEAEVACSGSSVSFSIELDNVNPNALPGFTYVNGGDGPWTISNGVVPGTGSNLANSGGNYLLYDGQITGGNDDLASFTTPAFDITGTTGQVLTFDYDFQDFAGNGDFTVEVWDGFVWIPIHSVTADTPFSGSPSVTEDVSVYANTDFQIRFTYEDAAGSAWGVGIDNIVVSSDGGILFSEDFENGLPPEDLPNYTITWTTPDGSTINSINLTQSIAFESDGSCTDAIPTQTVSYAINCVGAAGSPITGSFDVDVYPQIQASDYTLPAEALTPGSCTASITDNCGDLTFMYSLTGEEGPYTATAPTIATGEAAVVWYTAGVAGAPEGTACLASGSFVTSCTDNTDCPIFAGVSVEPASACSGEQVSLEILLANAIPSTGVVEFEETFDAGFGGFTSSVVTGPCDWATGTDSGSSIDGSPMAFFDDDACGDGAPASEAQLLSPVIDVSSLPGVILDFDYNFNTFDNVESFTAEVFDGTDWQVVMGPIVVDDCGFWGCSYPHFNADVSAYANPNFQVRFTYKDNGAWGFYAAIDNFRILSPAAGNFEVTATLPDGTPFTSQEILSGSVVVSSTSGCAPETVESDYTITCTVDGSTLASGTETVTIYPVLEEGVHYTLPGTISCSPVILSCSPGVLDIQYALDEAGPYSATPPASLNSGESLTVYYTVAFAGAPEDINAACQASGSFSIECTDCPTLNGIVANGEVFCGGEEITLSADLNGGIIQTPIPASGLVGSTVGAGSYFRPGAGATCVQSTTANVPYAAYTFTVDTDGDYDIEAAYNYDGYLHIYDGSFDPADPCATYITGDDDHPTTGTGGSLISGVSLTAGNTYVVVVSAFSAGISGDHTVTITGPGNAISTTVTYDVTWTYGGQTSNDPTATFVLDSPASSCSNEVQTVSYSIVCSGDGSPVASGSIDIDVYSPIQASDYTLPESLGCSSEITDNCGNLSIMYSLSGDAGSYSSTAPTLATDESLRVYYQIGQAGAPEGTPCLVEGDLLLSCLAAPSNCPVFVDQDQSADGICSGESVTLSVLVNNVFSVAPGFSYVNGGDGPWTVSNGSVPGTGSNLPNSGGNYLLYDGEAAGGLDDLASATTPPTDITGASGQTLSFDYDFQDFADNGDFIVEVWDGNAWVQVLGVTADTPFSSSPSFSTDVSAYANTEFQVRFTYSDAAGLAWGVGIDNISIDADSGNLFLENFENGLPPENLPNFEVAWTAPDGSVTTTASADQVYTLNNDACNVAVQQVSYSLTCVGDAADLITGSFSVNVYPVLEEGVHYTLPGTISCSPVILSCSPGVLDIQYALDEAGPYSSTPPAGLNSGESLTVYYTVAFAGAPEDINATCQASGSFSIECADCPTLNGIVANGEVFCGGEEITLSADLNNGIIQTPVPASGLVGSTVGAGSYFRPGAGVTCVQSTTANVPYAAYTFTVDTDGDYDIEAAYNYDGYLHIYDGSFDPADPCATYITGDDDHPTTGTGGSLISGVSLTAGNTYVLVVSAFSAGISGDHTVTITGPGNAISTTVTYDVTWTYGGQTSNDPTATFALDAPASCSNEVQTVSYSIVCSGDGSPVASGSYEIGVFAPISPADFTLPSDLQPTTACSAEIVDNCGNLNITYSLTGEPGTYEAAVPSIAANTPTRVYYAVNIPNTVGFGGGVPACATDTSSYLMICSDADPACPFLVDITASEDTVCDGTQVDFSANLINVFDAIPGFKYTDYGFPWLVGDAVFGVSLAGNFISLDDDDFGNGIDGTASFSLPTIDIAGETDVTLSFDYSYNDIGNTDNVSVDVSDGNISVNVLALNADATGNASIDIDALGLTGDDLTVTFTYFDGNSWAWGVGFDNISIDAASGNLFSEDFENGLPSPSVLNYEITWDYNGSSITSATTDASFVFDADGCSIVTQSVGYTITCVPDGTVVASGSVDVAVVPFPEINVDFRHPTAVSTPPFCSSALEDNCGGLEIQYSTDGGATYSSTAPSIALGDVITVDYIVNVPGAPAGCEATGRYVVGCLDQTCPSLASATQSQTEACTGSTVDFELSLNDISVLINGFSYAQDSLQWQVSDELQLAGSTGVLGDESGIDGNFIYISSTIIGGFFDGTQSGGPQSFTTQPVDLTGENGVLLNYSYDFEGFTQGGVEPIESFTVEVWDGTAWIEVLSVTADTFGDETVSLAPYINDAFQVRFTYDGDDAIQFFGVAIDNISITSVNGTLFEENFDGGLPNESVLNYLVTWTGPDGVELASSTNLSASFDFTNLAQCELNMQSVSYEVICLGGSAAPITGSFDVDVFPAPPANINSLIVTTPGECDSPTVVAIPGCEDFVTVTVASGPEFPVGLGADGIVEFDVSFNGGPCCTAPEPIELVADGSMEGGSSNADWDQFGESTNFPDGTFPVIDTGIPTSDGNFSAWLGGYGEPSLTTLTQDISIPVGESTILTFNILAGICDSPSDYMNVTIDGDVVYSINGSSSLCGITTFASQSIDLGAYADGGTHTLEFYCEEFAVNGGNTNFFVDEVSIVSTPFNLATTCNYPLIEVAYDCPGCPIPVEPLYGHHDFKCIGGNFTLPSTVPVDDDRLITYEWRDNYGNVYASGVPQYIEHSGNYCNGPEVEVFTLYLGCDSLPGYEVVGGTYVVVMYPEVPATAYQLPSSEGQCSAGIATECPALHAYYSLDGVNFSEDVPTNLNPGESQEVFYYVTTRLEEDGLPEIGSACAPTGSYTINCSQCPQPTAITNLDGDRCDGDDLGISASIELSGSNPADVDIQWLLNGELTGVTSDTYTGTMQAPDACGALTYTLQATVSCDLDGSTVFVDAGSATVYAAPQEGVDFETPANCEGAISVLCDGALDVLYVVNGDTASLDTLALVHGDTIAYSVSLSGAPDGCAATGTYNYACPQCATAELVSGIDGDYCASDDLSVTASIAVNDDAVATSSTIEWWLNGEATGETGSDYSGTLAAPAGCGAETYSLTAVVTCDLDGSETNVEAGTVTVYGLPEAGVDFTMPDCGALSNVCDGVSVSYTVDGVATSDLSNIAVGAVIGYSISVDGAPDGCAVTGEYTCMGDCPSVTAVSETDMSVCAGSTIELEVSVMVADETQVEWFDGEGNSLSTGTTYSADATNDGCDAVTATYTAVVAENTVLGCAEASATFTVTILPDPSNGVEVVVDGCTATLEGACDGTTVTYTVNGGSSMEGSSYTAMPEAGTSSSDGVVFSVASEECGTYDAPIAIVTCDGPALGSIAGYVFGDTNEDGIWDMDESGLEGLAVSLFNADSGDLVATEITAADGSYTFAEIAEGNYYVSFSTPDGYVISPKNATTDETLDSDANADGNTDVFSVALSENITDIGAGMYFVCLAEAGELSGASVYCNGGEVSVTGSGYTDDANYSQVYVLTQGEDNIVVAANMSGEFGSLASGSYCVHAVNYYTGDDFVMPGVGESADLLSGQEGCIDFDPSACFGITVTTSVQLSATAYCLDGTTGVFYAQVSVSGGLPESAGSGTYVTNLGNIDFVDGAAAGNFGPFNNGDVISISVTSDGAGCTSNTETVSFVCEASCTADAGDMPDDALNICAGDTTDLSATGVVLGEGDVLVYALHDGQGTEAGIIYAISSTGSFSLANVPAAGTYYVSSVAGPDAGDGTPDLDNGCTSVAAGTPVTFMPSIVVNANIQKSCNSTGGGIYTLTPVISGGAGGSYGLVVYVDGSEVFNGTASENTPFVLGPFETGTAYSLSVTDAMGCLVELGEVTECTVPVELLDFTGEVLTEGNLLKWVTATEINSDYFTLYHSTDGIEFKPISQDEAAGNSTLTLTYSHMHADAPDGISYYQLGQTDMDGTESLSTVINLYRGERSFDFVKVSPVPALNFVDISFVTETTGKVELSVRDVSGRLIDVMDVAAQKGSNTYTLDVNSYASGVYLLTLSNSETSITSRMVKE